MPGKVFTLVFWCVVLLRDHGALYAPILNVWNYRIFACTFVQDILTTTPCPVHGFTPGTFPDGLHSIVFSNSWKEPGTGSIYVHHKDTTVVVALNLGFTEGQRLVIDEDTVTAFLGPARHYCSKNTPIHSVKTAWFL